MKKYLILLLLTVLLGGCCDKGDIRVGDIIFTEQRSSDVERAIAEVTHGIEGYNFTHVGIVCKHGGILSVLEATSPEVTITPLEEFLKPKRGGVKRWAVGRLKPEYKKLIPSALEEGYKLLGADYDRAYTLGDDKYYCSELVYEILKRANDGDDVFELNVMTFVSPSTGEISDGWLEHFRLLGVPVPEGDMGINPGAMSRSDVIEIISFGESH